jgi:hypothetical protein
MAITVVTNDNINFTNVGLFVKKYLYSYYVYWRNAMETFCNIVALHDSRSSNKEHVSYSEIRGTRTCTLEEAHDESDPAPRAGQTGPGPPI